MRPQQALAHAETPGEDESGRPQTESPAPLLTTEVTTSPEVDTPQTSQSPLSTTSKDRYFILKSLSKEDLAWSVTNKVWATQPHNESVLNEAFKVPLSEVRANFSELGECLSCFQCQ